MNSLISHIEKPINKLTGQVEQLSLNGGMLIDMATLTNKTLYTSPYMVVNDQEYTKHYYAGSQRIASKLGAGFDGALVDIDVNVETINADVETIALDLVALLERSNTCAQIEWGNVTLPEPILPRVEELRYTSISNFESDMYFYHTDHLGSSSWITDASGDVNQHLQYLPLRQAQGSAFGEDYIYQRNSSWAVPYTFSGKEKDSETGYSYFGARYYDSDLSIWLSVDPLASKYPSMSAYMYVAGNPVMLVDPDGRKIKPTNDDSKSKMWSAMRIAFHGLGNDLFNFNDEKGGSGIIETKASSKNLSKRQFKAALEIERRSFNKKTSTDKINRFSRKEINSLYRLYKTIDTDEIYEVGFISPQVRVASGAVENSRYGQRLSTEIRCESNNMMYVLETFNSIELRNASKNEDGSFQKDIDNKLIFSDNAMQNVVNSKSIFLENLTDGTGFKKFSNGDLLIDYSVIKSASQRSKTFVENIGN
jgi:RHS repeat-associated protein